MIGIPPFGGFISKWYLAIGSVEAGLYPVLFVLALSTLLNASYFLPIIYSAFFKKPDCNGSVSGSGLGAGAVEVKDPTSLMTIPLLLTAAGALLLFFFPTLFFDLAKMTVAGIM